MQEFEKTEERIKKMNKSLSSNSSHSMIKCIDQVFQKKKYRGKYLKISNEKKNLLKDWLSKHPQPNSKDFANASQSFEEPLENVQKWYKNHKKTNKDIKIGKSKTKRILSKLEEEILEKAFRGNIKPKPEKYKELAKKITINSKQIRKWFKYRRRKLKKVFNDRIPMPSSQMKGNLRDSSESSYRNSSQNLSTNDLKSQKNNSSSDSNHLRQLKEYMENNQQESTSKTIEKEPEIPNIQVNNQQPVMNMPNNFSNIYQNQNIMNSNYPQMIFAYPFAQETPQSVPMISNNNNRYRVIQNTISPHVYLQNSSPYFINNQGFQQSNPLSNIQNYNINLNTPHYIVMNNRNGLKNEGSVTKDLIKTQSESFENMNSEKAQTYCFMNQNKPAQISNNQSLFNNFIYLKPNNEVPAFIPNQNNMMPNLNLIQNFQFLQPQNQAYCINGNNYTQNCRNGNFMNNGVYQMNGFNIQNVKMNINNQKDLLQNFNDEHKRGEN